MNFRSTIFWKSFRFDKTFLYAALLDVAYLALFYLVLSFTVFFYAVASTDLTGIKDVMASLQASLAGDVPLITTEMITQAETAKALFNAFVIKFILIVVVSVLLLLFLSGFFKGRTWALLRNTPYTKKYAFRFYAINTLWILLWVALAVILALLFTQAAASYLITAELFLFAYFSAILRSRFNPKKTLKESFKDALVFGSKNAYHFLILIVFVFLIINLLALALLPLSSLSSVLSSLIGVVVFVVLMTWLRVYITILSHQKF